MSADCQILLPGLLDLPFAELSPDLIKRQLPNLNRLLRYATVADNRLHSIDASIASMLGLREDPHYCLPMAQAYGGDSEFDHVLVDAVHLHPDLQNAILMPIEKSQRFQEELHILINDLNDLFKEDCHLKAIHDSTYLMRLESLSAPCFYPHPLSVLGKPANSFVEQSRQDLPWYRLLNEIQMFLHQHPVNQQRLAQGLLTINSLWCWGGGPARVSNAGCEWYCDDSVLNRYVESLGIATKPVGQLDAAVGSEPVLVVDLRLLAATKTGQDGDLAELLLDIETRILKPSMARFSGSLRLRSGCEFDFAMQPWSPLKFWRPRRDLQGWQQLLYSRSLQYS